MVSSIGDNSSISALFNLLNAQRISPPQTTSNVADGDTPTRKVQSIDNSPGQLSGALELGSSVVSVLLETQQVTTSSTDGGTPPSADGSGYQQGSFQTDFQNLLQALQS